jgi:hypothetical protein
MSTGMIAASSALAAILLGARALAPLRGHAGGEPGRACVRLEQQGHQPVSQNPGFGRLRVLAWRCGQTNEAFQAFKCHLDTPAGAV